MVGKQSTETNICVNLEEPLTTDSCLNVIMELLKYLLYEKEQIPLSYDSMQLFKLRVQPGDKNHSSFEKLFSTLEKLSNELQAQFFIEGCDIKEIVIACGATINTSKIIVRIQLPSKILSSKKHLVYHHNSRKPLMNLMRSICECEELQGALTSPMGLTNTFVMIQKSDPSEVSNFFLPKPDYRVPPYARQFCIKLVYDEQCLLSTCDCYNTVNVFNDSTQINVMELSVEESDNSNDEASLQWYQSKEVIKGFKFL